MMLSHKNFSTKRLILQIGVGDLHFVANSIKCNSFDPIVLHRRPTRQHAGHVTPAPVAAPPGKGSWIAPLLYPPGHRLHKCAPGSAKVDRAAPTSRQAHL